MATFLALEKISLNAARSTVQKIHTHIYSDFLFSFLCLLPVGFHATVPELGLAMSGLGQDLFSWGNRWELLMALQVS